MFYVGLFSGLSAGYTERVRETFWDQAGIWTQELDHSDMHVLGIFGCYIKYYLALKFLFVFQIDLTIEWLMVWREKWYIFFFAFPASTDYTALSRSLVFNGATGSQTVLIPIQDDMVVENQFESFFIRLSTSDSAVMLDPVSANVTVEDNDSELSLHAVYKRFAGCKFL